MILDIHIETWGIKTVCSQLKNAGFTILLFLKRTSGTTSSQLSQPAKTTMLFIGDNLLYFIFSGERWTCVRTVLWLLLPIDTHQPAAIRTSRCQQQAASSLSPLAAETPRAPLLQGKAPKWAPEKSVQWKMPSEGTAAKLLHSSHHRLNWHLR